MSNAALVAQKYLAVFAHSPPRVGLPWDSPHPPPESVGTGGRTYADVTTKISGIDRLPMVLRSAVFGRKGALLLRYRRQ